MKYMKVVVLSLFLICCTAAFAQDDGLVATQTQTPFQLVMTNILYAMAVPITAGIGALVHCLLAAMFVKMKISVSKDTQDVLTGAAETAAHKAEAWAESMKDTPSSNAKLNMAVQTMRQLIVGTPIGKTTNDQLSHYIEEAVYKIFNQQDPNVPTPVVVPPVVTP